MDIFEVCCLPNILKFAGGTSHHIDDPTGEAGVAPGDAVLSSCVQAGELIHMVIHPCATNTLLWS